MAREIDLLTEAAARAQTVVEKATNQTWELEELRQAQTAGKWIQEDSVRATVESSDVSGPFPGCMQRSGAVESYEGYRLLGQTRHFLLFGRGER
jgi:hypothetical protein